MSVVFSLIALIPGLFGKFLDWQTKKMDVELEGFRTAAGVDLAAYQAYVAAQIEINRMKLAQNSWWGAKLIILVAGVPASVHFGAVMLDSVPFPYVWLSGWWLPTVLTHEVGAWGIPKLPAPYDAHQWLIVQSFFLVMPVMTGVNAVAQWLNRR